MGHERCTSTRSTWTVREMWFAHHSSAHMPNIDEPHKFQRDVIEIGAWSPAEALSGRIAHENHQAQKLGFDLFAEELGATLDTEMTVELVDERTNDGCLGANGGTL